MSKYEIIVNGLTFKIDGINWDYPQTDSEETTRTDENVLYRDVLPEMTKVGVTFEKPSETELSRILKMRKLEECDVTYWDLREQQFVTKHCMPVSDEIRAMTLSDGTFICEPFEVRFIQMR